MLSLYKSVGGYQRQMSPLPGRKRLLEQIYPMEHLDLFFFVNRIRRIGEFHFTEVNDVVVPHDEQIHLAASLRIVALDNPCGNGGLYAFNSQCTLNLLDMLPANLFKSDATPSFHHVRCQIIINECGIILIRLDIFQPEQTEVIDKFVIFSSSLSVWAVTHDEIALCQCRKRIAESATKRKSGG